jgi:MoxR-like ATPase
VSAPKLSPKPAELLPVQEILKEVSRRIVGQDAMVERLLVGLLTGGHILLEGVPGLAKTLAVRTLAEIIHASFSRIQFTPDLLPADVIGTMVFNQKSQEFHVKKGPLFAQIILADEINRAPAKVQAALLEAMQEHQVTIGGTTYPLEEPFIVLATQNPMESEGTYPLPEAQLDRFMFHIVIEHPPEDEEFEVVRTTTAIIDPKFERTVTGEDLIAFQRLVRRVPVAEPVMRYALSLVRASRPKSPTCPDSVKKWVAFGGSVRAAQYLVLGAKARALTSGRFHVSFDDIRSMAHPVLRHRVLTNFHAQSEGISTDTLIDRLLESVAVPRSGM